jgi:peptidoglycan/LPS O-acetylase OafA/YrhL
VRRIPQLDGLRGIAIGLVVLHHFIYQFHAPMPETLTTIAYSVARLGWSGVDLFFILSGFLIGGILVDARDSESYYSTFYIRRVFRILPIYLALLFLGFLLVELPGRSGPAFGGAPLHVAPWLYYLTFTQNFFFASHVQTVWYLQVTWSLAVEEQFYLTLPLLVRTISREKLLAVVVSMVVFFAVLRSALYSAGHLTPMQAYVLPFCRFDSLFIGVTCALLLRDPTWSARFQKHPRLLLAATALCGCFFFLMDHNLWSKNLLLHTLGFTVISLFYASTMLLVLLHPQFVLSRALTYKPLIQLGTVSYCVYLIHGLVLPVVDQLVKSFLSPSDFEMWVVILTGMALTFLLAQGSWIVFESRMIALGHRFTYAGRQALKPATGTASNPVAS